MKKEKQRYIRPDIYGQFIVDFVNAETIMAAYCVLFDNLYKLFETDESFLWEVKHIKEFYDNFLQEFDELERKFVALSMREAEALFMLHEANDIIEDTVLGIGLSGEEEEKRSRKRKFMQFKDFDVIRKALVFALTPVEVDLPEELRSEPHQVIVDFDDKRLNPKYRLEYQELIKVHSEMEKIKKIITKDRLRYICQKTMDELNYLIDREGNLSMIRGVLRHFLEELSSSSDLRDSTLINTILNAYNEKPRDYYLDYEDGNLKESSPFDQDVFLEWIGGYGNEGFMFGWNNLIFRACSFAIVQFVDKEENRKRFKKCPYCNLFFIAKDNKRKRCYLESCNRKYEKEKKRKQRDDDPITYV